MVVTIMPSIHSLIPLLKADYPQFTFKQGDDFLWSPSERTVYYTFQKYGCGFLLHELSHGLLEHSEYSHDVELIAMEREAWDSALNLAKYYDMKIDDELIQSNLDTYRDWLHARSTCPTCDATGLQTKKHVYICPACSHIWKVNEARMCALRRSTV